jgi:ribosomal protein L37AE/L43A
MEPFGNQIKQILSNNYSCEKCNYTTVRKLNFDAHILTAKHIRKHNGNHKISNIYSCEKCNYNTVRKSNYDKHILSAKHISAGNQQKNKHICDNCNKEYKNRSGLWKHKQMCISTSQTDKTNTENITPELVVEIIKQNQEFKNMLIEQNKQIIELSKNVGNNNNNNNNNKTFNLKFFLNETCKDAINLKEFADSIVLQLSDIDNIGEVGLAKGLANRIIYELNLLGETKRPIHCTDLKREVMYVKDNNKWVKDVDKNNIRRFTKKIDKKLPHVMIAFSNNHNKTYRTDSEIIKQQQTIYKVFGGNKDEETNEDEIIRLISKSTFIKS